MTEEKIETAVEQEAPAKTESVMDQYMYDPEAPIVTIQKLFEAGAHYGHQTKRWNPKMKKYIHSSVNHIHIMDLGKTVSCINDAYLKLKEIVEATGKVLIVGTKPQLKETIEMEANRSGSFYINNRWLGGTLTNFSTINKRIKYLKELEADEKCGKFDVLSKFEASLKRKEKEKLDANLNGIKEMRGLPNALIIVDPTVEYNAVREAKRCKIPVFAIIGTNADPDLIDYPIPANDDSNKSVSLVLGILVDAIVEAKSGVPATAHCKFDGTDIDMASVFTMTKKANDEKVKQINAEREANRLQREKEMNARRGNYDRTRASKGEKPAEEKKDEEK